MLDRKKKENHHEESREIGQNNIFDRQKKSLRLKRFAPFIGNKKSGPQNNQNYVKICINNHRQLYSTKSTCLSFKYFIIISTIILIINLFVVWILQDLKLEASPTVRGMPMIQRASAEPAPEPKRSVSSSGRPPINGSIFGKRSLYSGKKLAMETSNNKLLTKTIPLKAQSSQDKQNNSRAKNYIDIITQLIDDFLTNNNDADSKQVTVKFCRMIIYECNQLLRDK